MSSRRGDGAAAGAGWLFVDLFRDVAKQAILGGCSPRRAKGVGAQIDLALYSDVLWR